jgi:5-methylcytosine-specific restriction endonuclease McrA
MQIDATTSLKTCRLCQEPQPLDQFHRDKARASGRDSRCKACKNRYSKQWRGAHPEYFGRYRSEHLAEFSAYGHRYRDRNPEYQRRWVQANPAKAKLRKVHDNNRRKGAEGRFSANEWDALCAKYGYRCLCCGRSDLPLTVDHICPVSKGGSNWVANLQPLCGPCNFKKHDKVIDYRPTE